MPTEDYLLTRRETLVMEQNENGGAGEDWVEGMEDELFDDFVVL